MNPSSKFYQLLIILLVSIQSYHSVPSKFPSKLVKEGQQIDESLRQIYTTSRNFSMTLNLLLDQIHRLPNALRSLPNESVRTLMNVLALEDENVRRIYHFPKQFNDNNGARENLWHASKMFHQAWQVRRPLKLLQEGYGLKLKNGQMPALLRGRLAQLNTFASLLCQPFPSLLVTLERVQLEMMIHLKYSKPLCFIQMAPPGDKHLMLKWKRDMFGIQVPGKMSMLYKEMVNQIKGFVTYVTGLDMTDEEMNRNLHFASLSLVKWLETEALFGGEKLAKEETERNHRFIELIAKFFEQFGNGNMDVNRVPDQCRFGGNDYIRI